jgi:glycosyltransferase involved in cell wall biosynthesis
LEREQIKGPIEYHSHVSPSDVLKVQREADILFLPLAFNSPIPETVKTSAPGKMGEYLASGRPILAHAPADSFVSWYFRERECGVVVDCSDPLILKHAIERILDDSDLRQRVSRNARICAQSDFSLKVVQTQFLTFLNNEVRR